MQDLVYTARTLYGEKVEGKAHVKDEATLRLNLSEKGMEILSVSAQGEQVESKPKTPVGERFRLFNPVRPSELRWITSQFSLMLETGTTVAESLMALSEQSEGTPISEILSDVHNSVNGGATLSAALGEHPRVYSSFYVSAVKAGEASGTLPEVFARLELHMKKREEMVSTIRAALTYPMILSTLAVGAVMFMMTFVLPKFVTVFASFGAELPLPTRMLMSLAGIFRSYWYAILLFVFGPMAGAYWYFTGTRGKPVLDRLVLNLPIVGPVVRMVQTSVILRTLGTLINAGVPLVECMSVAEDSCSNGEFKRTVREISNGIIRGEGFSRNFGASALFTPSTKQMVATGERTGSMGYVMTKVADHLDDEADKTMKLLGTLIEPLIIIVMGFIIGFIAIALLFPLFRLSSAVRGGA